MQRPRLAAAVDNVGRDEVCLRGSKDVRVATVVAKVDRGELAVEAVRRRQLDFADDAVQNNN
jgi:hypothetical protein